MTKKVCISGYYGFENFGDETILKILVENLKSAENPPEITVFSANPDKTFSSLSVNSVNTFKITEVIKEIIRSDCLISGGGSLLQDVTSAKSILYYLFVLAIAQIFGKKTVVFAQGIGPIRNNILKNLTMFILKGVNYITVRDTESFNLLMKNRVKHVEQCCDPVWNLLVKKLDNTEKIGIQLRQFSFVNEEFIRNLAAAITTYYRGKEVYILSLQNSQDLEVCNKLKTQILKVDCETKVSVLENTSNDKVISDICSLDSLIAMRYHACLVAIKAGVRVLPIKYDIKVENLAKDFGLDCINLVDEIDNKINSFSKSEIVYDEEKINAKQFDFSKLSSLLQ